MSSYTVTRRHAISGTELVVMWLEAMLAVGAYGGAVALIGGVIDFGDATADLPFASPVFAGLALALIIGVLPTAVFVAAVRRRPWAGDGHLVVGAALVAWIVVQVAILGPPIVPIQGLYFAWGVAIIALAVRLRRGPRTD